MRKWHFSQCGNLKQSYEEELTIFSTDFGRFWSAVGLVILLALIPLVGSPYTLYILNTIGIYAIAALGLNLLIIPGVGLLIFVYLLLLIRKRWKQGFLHTSELEKEKKT